MLRREAGLCGPKQDIANVNGFLRCVFLNDPNSLGIISMTKHEKDDRTETLVWRVDQPEVKAPEAFYSVIKFKPGDMISISAGGCVQTGGSGSTWKSYTKPLGDNADHLYSGTISIPGVTEGGLQRIGGMLAPKEWIVPWDLPPTVLNAC